MGHKKTTLFIVANSRGVEAGALGEVSYLHSVHFTFLREDALT